MRLDERGARRLAERVMAERVPPRAVAPRPRNGLRLTPLRAVIGALVLSIVIVTVLAVVTPSRAIASSSLLTVLAGEVQIEPAPGAGFRRGQDGEPLKAGMTVRATAGSRGVLTFEDGSTMELEPDTAVAIDEVAIGSRGELLVRVEQQVGRTWSHVQPLLSVNSRFHVKTPSATAVVRGTSFQVDVEKRGGDAVTKFDVFQGQVDVVSSGTVRPVTAGQTLAVADPAFPSERGAIVPPAVRLRVGLTGSAAMMSATDPERRTSGQTPLGTVDQIPQTTVSGPRDQPQMVDVFAPRPGDWEIAILPIGDGGSFELILNSIVGKDVDEKKVITGSVLLGQRLTTTIHVAEDGRASAFGPLEVTAASRAKLATTRLTASAPAADARRFAPPLDELAPSGVVGAPAAAAVALRFLETRTDGPVSVPPATVGTFALQPSAAALVRASAAPTRTPVRSASPAPPSISLPADLRGEVNGRVTITATISSPAGFDPESIRFAANASDLPLTQSGGAVLSSTGRTLTITGTFEVPTAVRPGVQPLFACVTDSAGKPVCGGSQIAIAPAAGAPRAAPAPSPPAPPRSASPVLELRAPRARGLVTLGGSLNTVSTISSGAGFDPLPPATATLGGIPLTLQRTQLINDALTVTIEMRDMAIAGTQTLRVCVADRAARVICGETPVEVSAPVVTPTATAPPAAPSPTPTPKAILLGPERRTRIAGRSRRA